MLHLRKGGVRSQHQPMCALGHTGAFDLITLWRLLPKLAHCFALHTMSKAFLDSYKAKQTYLASSHTSFSASHFHLVASTSSFCFSCFFFFNALDYDCATYSPLVNIMDFVQSIMGSLVHLAPLTVGSWDCPKPWNWQKMQTPKRMDKVVVEDYYHMTIMDENVNWMELAHLFSIFFSKS